MEEIPIGINLQTKQVITSPNNGIPTIYLVGRRRMGMSYFPFRFHNYLLNKKWEKK